MTLWRIDPEPSGARFLGPCCVRCGVPAPAWALTAAKGQTDLLTCEVCAEAKCEIAKRSDEPEPVFNPLRSEER